MYAVSDHNSISHYENFPVASFLCPAAIRPAVVAIYNFARVADDLADEGQLTAGARLEALRAYRAALQGAIQGDFYDAAEGAFGGAGLACDLPWLAVMRPLQAAIAQHQLPAQPLHDLLTAFERDVAHTASGYVYADWDALLDYARYSANPVGRLMLHLYGVHEAQAYAQSDAICTALQLYNFWQDISVDVARQRFYLPSAFCEPLGIDPRAPDSAPAAQRQQLLFALLDYTDALMHSGKALPRLVAQRSSWLAGLELQMVVQGGLRIGQKTRRLGANATCQRPRLHAGDFLAVFGAGLAGLLF